MYLSYSHVFCMHEYSQDTVGVGVVFPPSKTKHVEKFTFANLLRCIIDCINHNSHVFCMYK